MLKETENLKNAVDGQSKSKSGQGFGGNQTPKQPAEGASQALALAQGLEATLLAQAQSVSELAAKTDQAAAAIAAPIAEFVVQVTTGELIMAKIAEQVAARNPGAQSFSDVDVSVNAPKMPQLSSAKISDNFFASPKRITGV